MDGLSSLVKLLSERGSLLVAAALLAGGVAVARWNGQLADVNQNGVHLLYAVGAFCGLVLLTGGLGALWKSIRAKARAAFNSRRRREQALRNLPTLPDRYAIILLWLVANNTDRFSVEGYVDDLEELANSGYLERADVRDFQSVFVFPSQDIRSFTVPKHIWDELRSDGVSTRKSKLPKQRPWERQSTRA